MREEMDHREIEADNLVERYVLGRLPVDEQVRFEQHFAGCQACVEELEMARELHSGLREVATEDARRVLSGGLLAVLARQRRWIVPLAVVLVALPAVWLAMQNQRLRSELADLHRPLANVPTFLLAVSRDASAPVPVLEVPDEHRWLALSIEAAPGVDSYAATLRDAAGQILWQEAALEPNLWDILLLTLPRELLTAGEYALVLQAADGGPPVNYRFRID